MKKTTFLFICASAISTLTFANTNNRTPKVIKEQTVNQTNNRINPSATSLPVSNFTANKLNPCVGEIVQFSNLSTGGATNFSWQFTSGSSYDVQYVDGTTPFSANPRVKFNSVGPYTVIFRVTNSSGTNQMTKTNFIKPLARPSRPVITLVNTSVPFGGTIAMSVPQGNPGTIYTWISPNGSTLNLTTNSFTKQNANINDFGTYKVALSNGGCQSDFASATVTKSNSPAPFPTISISASRSSICSNESITYTAVAVNLPAGAAPIYKWYIGSNATPAQASSSPIFTNAALTQSTTVKCVLSAYVNNVIVSYNSNPLYISVSPKPATPILTSNSPVNAGNSINLSTNSVVGATYSWNGPIGFSTNTSTSTVMRTANAGFGGTYSVRIAVNGCYSDAATTAVVVNGSATVPTLTITSSDADNRICQGELVKFTAIPSAGTTNMTYKWLIGNQIVGSGPIFQTTTLNSTQVVKCLMTLINGAQVTSNMINTIVTPRPGIPTLMQTTANVSVGSTINLSTAAVNGAIYRWSGPDAFSTTTTTPNCNLVAKSTSGGIYKVQVETNGCASDYGQTNVAVATGGNPRVILSSYDADNKICQGEPVAFVANVQNAPANSSLRYVWHFGNGGDAMTTSNYFVASNQLATSTWISCEVYIGTAVSGTISNIIQMTVIPKPATPALFSNSPVTAGGVLNLSTPAVAGATYYWVYPTISGPSQYSTQSLNGFNASNSGVYQVAVIKDGCKSNYGQTVVSMRQNAGLVAAIVAPTSDEKTEIIKVADLKTNAVNPEKETQQEAAVAATNVISSVDPIVNVYPNPTSGKFTVKLVNTENENNTVEVRNMLGQVIFQEEMTSGTEIRIKDFDLTGFEQGTYFVTVTGKASVFTSKIILN